MLEALRLGSPDFGTVGDMPPIFAQAAHADLLYVAVMRAGSSSAAILLPPGSTLQTLGDLKGTGTDPDAHRGRRRHVAAYRMTLATTGANRMITRRTLLAALPALGICTAATSGMAAPSQTR